MLLAASAARSGGLARRLRWQDVRRVDGLVGRQSALAGGPSSSIGASRYCITQADARQTTASAAAAAGCDTFASPVPSHLSQHGRSTHVLWIPDSAVGEHHQMRAWLDLDGDGSHDGDDETYVTFESNFSSRTLTEADTYRYEYPRDFELELSGRVG